MDEATITEAARQRDMAAKNRRLAWVLLSIVVVIFAGFLIKQWMMKAG